MGKRKRCPESALARTRAKRIRLATPVNGQTERRKSVRLQNKKVNVQREAERVLPSPVTTDSNLNNRSLKRKRTTVDEGSVEGQQRQLDLIPREIGVDQLVSHWVLTNSWPRNLGRQDLNMSHAPSSKRRSSSSHRSQVLERMASHGIYMESSSLIEKDSKELCETYLIGEHQTVKTSMFTFTEFDKVLDRVRNLNEARIQRDITPWVVPSAEALIIRGELKNDWIGEELNSEWSWCATFGSKTPKPDFTAGLRPDSFTSEEIEKLENYATPARPFHFTPALCFPFLICEAKTGERGLNEADRQNIHSVSIAARALVSLYHEAFGSTAPHRVQELMGRALVFTVSHDNDRVLLYGHFAIADHKVEGGLKFFRHPIDLFSLSTRGGADRLKAYNFVTNVYEKFAVEHRQRIKDAVAQLAGVAERTGLSFAASDLTIAPPKSTEDSQEALSQGDIDFATPGEPASIAQKREMTKMREQIDRLVQQMEQQRQDAKQQMEQQREDAKQQAEQQRQQMEQQMEQQREDAQQQAEQQRQRMEQQMEQQREDAQQQAEQQRQRMEQQTEQQREDAKQQAERQRQQMEQQREDAKQQMEQQLKQQNDIITLLKETRKS